MVIASFGVSFCLLLEVEGSNTLRDIGLAEVPVVESFQEEWNTKQITIV